LLLHPIEPGEARAVPNLRPGSEVVGWIRDGLLVTESSEALDLGDVTLVHPDTGARRPWHTIAPLDPSGIMFVSGLSVAPDGGSYAYSWHRALSNLYEVEGLIRA